MMAADDCRVALPHDASLAPVGDNQRESASWGWSASHSNMLGHQGWSSTTMECL